MIVQVQDYMGRLIRVMIDFAWKTHPAEQREGKPDARALGRVIDPDLEEYPINCQVMVERWPGDEQPHKMTGRRDHLSVHQF